MWIYHSVSRVLVGPSYGAIPEGHSATAVEPPESRPGIKLLFGYDGRWEPHGVPAVTRAQGRLALHRTGLLPQIEAVIAQADMEARIWYEDAQTWERDHPVVIQLGQALGLTSDQIDQLFLSA